MSDRTRDERRDDPDRTTTVDERHTDPDHRADYGANPTERGKWVSALIVLAGLWLILEPFLLEDALLGNLTNDVIVGILLVVLGGYNYYRRSNKHLGSTAVAGLVALIGLWLIVSPFVYGDAGPAAETTDFGFWNDVIVGLIVFGLGAYSAYAARETPAARTTAAEQ